MEQDLELTDVTVLTRVVSCGVAGSGCYGRCLPWTGHSRGGAGHQLRPAPEAVRLHPPRRSNSTCWTDWQGEYVDVRFLLPFVSCSPAVCLPSLALCFPPPLGFDAFSSVLFFCALYT